MSNTNILNYLLTHSKYLSRSAFENFWDTYIKTHQLSGNLFNSFESSFTFVTPYDNMFDYLQASHINVEGSGEIDLDFVDEASKNLEEYLEELEMKVLSYDEETATEETRKLNEDYKSTFRAIVAELEKRRLQSVPIYSIKNSTLALSSITDKLTTGFVGYVRGLFHKQENVMRDLSDVFDRIQNQRFYYNNLIIKRFLISRLPPGEEVPTCEGDSREELEMNIDRLLVPEISQCRRRLCDLDFLNSVKDEPMMREYHSEATDSPDGFWFPDCVPLCRSELKDEEKVKKIVSKILVDKFSGDVSLKVDYKYYTGKDNDVQSKIIETLLQKFVPEEKSVEKKTSVSDRSNIFSKSASAEGHKGEPIKVAHSSEAVLETSPFKSNLKKELTNFPSHVILMDRPNFKRFEKALTQLFVRKKVSSLKEKSSVTELDKFYYVEIEEKLTKAVLKSREMDEKRHIVVINNKIFEEFQNMIKNERGYEDAKALTATEFADQYVKKSEMQLNEILTRQREFTPAGNLILINADLFKSKVFEGKRRFSTTSKIEHGNDPYIYMNHDIYRSMEKDLILKLIDAEPIASEPKTNQYVEVPLEHLVYKIETSKKKEEVDLLNVNEEMFNKLEEVLSSVEILNAGGVITEPEGDDYKPETTERESLDVKLESVNSMIEVDAKAEFDMTAVVMEDSFMQKGIDDYLFSKTIDTTVPKDGNFISSNGRKTPTDDGGEISSDGETPGGGETGKPYILVETAELTLKLDDEEATLITQYNEERVDLDYKLNMDVAFANKFKQKVRHEEEIHETKEYHEVQKPHEVQKTHEEQKPQQVQKPHDSKKPRESQTPEHKADRIPLEIDDRHSDTKTDNVQNIEKHLIVDESGDREDKSVIKSREEEIQQLQTVVSKILQGDAEEFLLDSTKEMEVKDETETKSVEPVYSLDEEGDYFQNSEIPVKKSKDKMKPVLSPPISQQHRQKLEGESSEIKHSKERELEPTASEDNQLQYQYRDNELHRERVTKISEGPTNISKKPTKDLEKETTAEKAFAKYETDPQLKHESKDDAFRNQEIANKKDEIMLNTNEDEQNIGKTKEGRRKSMLRLSKSDKDDIKVEVNKEQSQKEGKISPEVTKDISKSKSDEEIKERSAVEEVEGIKPKNDTTLAQHRKDESLKNEELRNKREEIRLLNKNEAAFENLEKAIDATEEILEKSHADSEAASEEQYHEAKDIVHAMSEKLKQGEEINMVKTNQKAFEQLEKKIETGFTEDLEQAESKETSLDLEEAKQKNSLKPSKNKGAFLEDNETATLEAKGHDTESTLLEHEDKDALTKKEKGSRKRLKVHQTAPKDQKRNVEEKSPKSVLVEYKTKDRKLQPKDENSEVGDLEREEKNEREEERQEHRQTPKYQNEAYKLEEKEFKRMVDVDDFKLEKHRQTAEHKTKIYEFDQEELKTKDREGDADEEKLEQMASAEVKQKLHEGLKENTDGKAPADKVTVPKDNLKSVEQIGDYFQQSDEKIDADKRAKIRREELLKQQGDNLYENYEADSARESGEESKRHEEVKQRELNKIAFRNFEKQPSEKNNLLDAEEKPSLIDEVGKGENEADLDTRKKDSDKLPDLINLDQQQEHDREKIQLLKKLKDGEARELLETQKDELDHIDNVEVLRKEKKVELLKKVKDEEVQELFESQKDELSHIDNEEVLKKENKVELLKKLKDEEVQEPFETQKDELDQIDEVHTNEVQLGTKEELNKKEKLVEASQSEELQMKTIPEEHQKNIEEETVPEEMEESIAAENKSESEKAKAKAEVDDPTMNSAISEVFFKPGNVEYHCDIYKMVSNETMSTDKPEAENSKTKIEERFFPVEKPKTPRDTRSKLTSPRSSKTRKAEEVVRLKKVSETERSEKPKPDPKSASPLVRKPPTKSSLKNKEIKDGNKIPRKYSTAQLRGTRGKTPQGPVPASIQVVKQEDSATPDTVEILKSVTTIVNSSTEDVSNLLRSPRIPRLTKTQPTTPSTPSTPRRAIVDSPTKRLIRANLDAIRVASSIREKQKKILETGEESATSKNGKKLKAFAQAKEPIEINKLINRFQGKTIATSDKLSTVSSSAEECRSKHEKPIKIVPQSTKTTLQKKLKQFTISSSRDRHQSKTEMRPHTTEGISENYDKSKQDERMLHIIESKKSAVLKPVPPAEVESQQKVSEPKAASNVKAKASAHKVVEAKSEQISTDTTEVAESAIQADGESVQRPKSRSKCKKLGLKAKTKQTGVRKFFAVGVNFSKKDYKKGEIFLPNSRRIDFSQGEHFSSVNAENIKIVETEKHSDNYKNINISFKVPKHVSLKSDLTGQLLPIKFDNIANSIFLGTGKTYPRKPLDNIENFGIYYELQHAKSKDEEGLSDLKICINDNKRVVSGTPSPKTEAETIAEKLFIKRSEPVEASRKETLDELAEKRKMKKKREKELIQEIANALLDLPEYEEKMTKTRTKKDTSEENNEPKNAKTASMLANEILCKNPPKPFDGKREGCKSSTIKKCASLLRINDFMKAIRNMELYKTYSTRNCDAIYDRNTMDDIRNVLYTENQMKYSRPNFGSRSINYSVMPTSVSDRFNIQLKGNQVRHFENKLKYMIERFERKKLFEEDLADTEHRMQDHENLIKYLTNSDNDVASEFYLNECLKSLDNNIKVIQIDDELTDDVIFRDICKSRKKPKAMMRGDYFNDLMSMIENTSKYDIFYCSADKSKFVPEELNKTITAEEVVSFLNVKSKRECSIAMVKPGNESYDKDVAMKSSAEEGEAKAKETELEDAKTPAAENQAEIAKVQTVEVTTDPKVVEHNGNSDGTSKRMELGDASKALESIDSSKCIKTAGVAKPLESDSTSKTVKPDGASKLVHANTTGKSSKMSSSTSKIASSQKTPKMDSRIVHSSPKITGKSSNIDSKMVNSTSKMTSSLRNKQTQQNPRRLKCEQILTATGTETPRRHQIPSSIPKLEKPQTNVRLLQVGDDAKKPKIAESKPKSIRSRPQTITNVLVKEKKLKNTETAESLTERVNKKLEQLSLVPKRKKMGNLYELLEPVKTTPKEEKYAVYISTGVRVDVKSPPPKIVTNAKTSKKLIADSYGTYVQKAMKKRAQHEAENAELRMNLGSGGIYYNDIIGKSSSEGFFAKYLKKNTKWKEDIERKISNLINKMKTADTSWFKRTKKQIPRTKSMPCFDTIKPETLNNSNALHTSASESLGVGKNHQSGSKMFKLRTEDANSIESCAAMLDKIESIISDGKASETADDRLILKYSSDDSSNNLNITNCITSKEHVSLIKDKLSDAGKASNSVDNLRSSDNLAAPLEGPVLGGNDTERNCNSNTKGINEDKFLEEAELAKQASSIASSVRSSSKKEIDIDELLKDSLSQPGQEETTKNLSFNTTQKHFEDLLPQKNMPLIMTDLKNAKLNQPEINESSTDISDIALKNELESATSEQTIKGTYKDRIAPLFKFNSVTSEFIRKNRSSSHRLHSVPKLLRVPTKDKLTKPSAHFVVDKVISIADLQKCIQSGAKKTRKCRSSPTTNWSLGSKDLKPSAHLMKTKEVTPKILTETYKITTRYKRSLFRPKGKTGVSLHSRENSMLVKKANAQLSEILTLDNIPEGYVLKHTEEQIGTPHRSRFGPIKEAIKACLAQTPKYSVTNLINPETSVSLGDEEVVWLEANADKIEEYFRDCQYDEDVKAGLLKAAKAGAIKGIADATGKNASTGSQAGEGSATGKATGVQTGVTSFEAHAGASTELQTSERSAKVVSTEASAEARVEEISVEAQTGEVSTEASAGGASKKVNEMKIGSLDTPPVLPAFDKKGNSIKSPANLGEYRKPYGTNVKNEIPTYFRPSSGCVGVLPQSTLWSSYSRINAIKDMSSKKSEENTKVIFKFKEKFK